MCVFVLYNSIFNRNCEVSLIIKYWLKCNTDITSMMPILILSNISLYQAHEDICQYAEVFCRACSTAVERRLLENHKTNECVNRAVTCTYCGGQVRLSDMKVFSKFGGKRRELKERRVISIHPKGGGARGEGGMWINDTANFGRFVMVGSELQVWCIFLAFVEKHCAIA